MRLAAVSVAAVVLGPAFARADTLTHTYTFSSTPPIVFQNCFASPGCAAPLQAEPYPSPITVAGVTGHVVNVSVTLHNLALYSDSAPYIEIELQGPTGASLLMSGAGGATQPQGNDLTFAGGYPSLTDAGVPGTYAPTVGATPDFPFGPPTTTSDLSPYVNTDPNGAWNLWVAGRDTLLEGAIGGGWQLNITTTPYANTSPLALNAPPLSGPAQAADLYPSPITVSGLTGVVATVHPTIAGLDSSGPDDLDFLLADPAGDSTELLADAGGRSTMGTVASDLAFTFDDFAPSSLPDNTQLFGGVFRPSVYNDGPPAVFPSPAPVGPYSTALANLAGRNPNGTWNLFGINDEARSDSMLQHGWDLDITTRPASAVQLSASAFAAVRGRPLAVTITRGAPASGPATLHVATLGGTAVAHTDYTPVSTTIAFASGETSTTVTIPIGTAGRGGTFRVALSSPTDDASLAAQATATATVTVPGPNAGPGPTLGSFRILPSRFRAARRGASLARRRTPVGAIVSYRDSLAATTVFKVERRAAGIRRGRACVARPRRPHGHPRRCTRIVVVGSFHHTDRSGANRLQFTGRVRGHALARGRYKLVATPTSAGRSGPSASASFQIR